MTDTSGSTVGGAYVDIRPDFDAFEEELEAGLEEATSTAEGTVEINADLAAAEAEVDAFVTQVDAKDATITINADTGPALGEEAAAGAGGLGLDEGLISGGALADLESGAAGAQGAVSALDQAVLSLGGDMSTAEVATAGAAQALDAMAAGSADAAAEVATIAQAADAALVSYTDLTSALGAAGISFDDIAAGAEQVGATTEQMATALAYAALSFDSLGPSVTDTASATAALAAQGDALSSFFAEAVQGGVAWDMYVPQMAAGATSLAEGVGRLGASGGSLTALLGEMGGLSAEMKALVEAQQGLSQAFASFQQTLYGAQEVSNTFADAIGAMAEVDAAATAATRAYQAGMTEAAGAMDDFVAPADVAAAAIDKILQGEVEATGSGGGFIGTINGIGNAMAGAGGSMAQFSSGMSTTLEVVLALAPELAALTAAAVGFGGAMVGGLLTAGGAFGAFALAAVGDMQNLEGEFDVVKQDVEQWGGSLSSVIDSGLQPFIQSIDPLLQSLSPVVVAVSGAFRELGQAFGQVVQSSAWSQFVSFLGQVGPQVIESMVTAVEKFAGALADMAEAGAPVIEMIGRGFVSLAQDLENFANSNEFAQFVSWLETNGPTIGQVIANIAGMFEKLLTAFAEVGGYVMPVVEDLTKFADAILSIPGVGPIAAIGTAIAGMGALAAPALITVGAGLGALTGAGTAAGIGMAAGLGVAGVAAIGLVGVSAAATVEIGDHWSGVKTAAGDVGNWFSDSMPHFFESAFDDITGSASDWQGHIASLMADGVEGPAGDLVNFFSGPFAGGIKQGMDDTLHWFEEGWDDVVSFFEGLPGKLLQIGTDIIEGLWNGLKAAWNDVFGWLTDAANDIIKIFKDVLSILSPSAVMHEIGVSTMQGLHEGLVDGWIDVDAFLRTSANNIVTAYNGALGASPLVAPVSPLGPSYAELAGVGSAPPTTLHVEFSGPLTISGTTSNEETAALVQAAQDRFARQLATVVNIRSRGHS